jgi:hypothetical protein
LGRWLFWAASDISKFSYFSSDFLCNSKLQGKLSLIQIGIVSQKLWHFFSRNLQFNYELSHVALSHVSPLSHVLPCFPILMHSSLHLVIFKHPYLTHMKSDFRNFSAMNLALHILHIYHLDFHLKKNILPSNFEKILWRNKFLKVPPCRNYFL